MPGSAKDMDDYFLSKTMVRKYMQINEWMTTKLEKAPGRSFVMNFLQKSYFL